MDLYQDEERSCEKCGNLVAKLKSFIFTWNRIASGKKRWKMRKRKKRSTRRFYMYQVVEIILVETWGKYCFINIFNNFRVAILLISLSIWSIISIMVSLLIFPKTTKKVFEIRKCGKMWLKIYLDWLKKVPFFMSTKKFLLKA